MVFSDILLSVKKCSLKDHFQKTKTFRILLNREEYFDSFKVQPGGYGVEWDVNMSLSDAIADSIRETVEKQLGERPYNYDGYGNSEWIVIDYGTIYAHIFLPECRERYKLEELWNDATIERLPDED